MISRILSSLFLLASVASIPVPASGMEPPAPVTLVHGEIYNVLGRLQVVPSRVAENVVLVDLQGHYLETICVMNPAHGEPACHEERVNGMLLEPDQVQDLVEIARRIGPEQPVIVTGTWGRIFSIPGALRGLKVQSVRLPGSREGLSAL